MKNITTNKLQNDLSKVIKEVENGEVYQISRYSQPVAFLVSKKDYEGLLAGQDCKKCVSDLRKLANRIN